jgi:hypothetical protein
MGTGDKKPPDQLQGLSSTAGAFCAEIVGPGCSNFLQSCLQAGLLCVALHVTMLHTTTSLIPGLCVAPVMAGGCSHQDQVFAGHPHGKNFVDSGLLIDHDLNNSGLDTASDGL